MKKNKINKKNIINCIIDFIFSLIENFALDKNNQLTENPNFLLHFRLFFDQFIQ